MSVSVFDFETSAKSGEAALPAVFTAPIRPDIVTFVHTQMAKNKRQAYAVSTGAGHQTSAQSWGTGRAVARIPRVQGGGTQRSGQGAFGNMCRGGRMFAPTKVWRKWHKKINVNQRRHATVSALAATAYPALVMARGHSIDDVPELPLVIGGSFQQVKRTAKALEGLTKLGAGADIAKAGASKKVRTGKGKMRNRRYVMRRGPLIIYDAKEGVEMAARNLTGVELCQVERLNLLTLAPGGHLGRFVIFTEAAFAKLDSIFGTYTEGSAQKSGYALFRSQMTNADLASVINSAEIQAAVRPVEARATKVPRKKNPFKNLGAMARLNPYQLHHRKSEMAAEKARAAKKTKAASARRTEKGAKVASRAFWARVNEDGEVPF